MSESIVIREALKRPLIQLHLEPDEPIDIRELTAELGALTRQYQRYVSAEAPLGRNAETKLLVWSVAPGSIDIGLLTDWHSIAGVLAPVYDHLAFVLGFANKIKWLLDLFAKKPSDAMASAVAEDITIQDCTDAAAIAAPIMNHGGQQTVSVHNGDIIIPIFVMDPQYSAKIVEHATGARSHLRLSSADAKQRVPLVWESLDRKEGKTTGKASPDKARIEEIDPDAKPTFFTDDMLYLKDEMIGDDDENPYQKVYFVDVEVSSVQGKVVSYRIIGFHGKDDLR